jgi:ribosomal protein S18 acetylase RimI-like enzyme
MVKIRAATQQDAKTIVDLVQSQALADGESSPLSEAYVSRYLASPTSGILLAMENDRAVGLLSYSARPDLSHAGDCYLIEELVVVEEKRSQRIGGLLMKNLLACAQQKGCVEIAVGVMPDNIRAQQFYRRHGLVDEALLLERHYTP